MGINYKNEIMQQKGLKHYNFILNLYRIHKFRYHNVAYR